MGMYLVAFIDTKVSEKKVSMRGSIGLNYKIASFFYTILVFSINRSLSVADSYTGWKSASWQSFTCGRRAPNSGENLLGSKL